MLMSLADLMIRFKNLDSYSRPEQKRVLERLMFELYLRKGHVPPPLRALHIVIDFAPPGIKLNPYHDELGRFTFAPGGSEDDKPDDNGDTGTSAPRPTEPGDGGMRVVQEELPPDILLDEPSSLIKPPVDKFPTDPTQPPAPGFQWKGNGPPGSPQGNWHNPDTGENFHPDLDHPPPKGPHWDYDAPDGSSYRWYPDGRMEPKNPAVVITA
jgi:hypothetical protein